MTNMCMKRFTTRAMIRGAICVAVPLLGWSNTGVAVPLPPGGSVTLSGATTGTGIATVIHDELIPFEIYGNSGGGGQFLYSKGILKHRVMRLHSTGTLVFAYQIQDTYGSLNGIIDQIEVTRFDGFYNDVEYRGITGPSAAPDSAQRSAAGDTVWFNFVSDPIYPGLDSRLNEVATDALTFEPGGRTRIKLQTGEFVDVATMRPSHDFDAGCRKIDFEDRPLDSTYPVGSTFVSNGIPIHVHEFYFGPGGCTTPYANGYARVQDAGYACGSGQEIQVNNVNLEIDYGVELSTMEIHFGEYGGNVNFSVNGDCVNTGVFANLPAIIGGVAVSVTNIDPPGNGCGVIRLEGPILDVRIGGQELWIDDISCEVDPCDMDNDPPVAILTEPTDLDCVCDPVVVSGTAIDDNFDSYTLEYRHASEPSWSLIRHSNTPVLAGTLGVWNATGLPQGYYLLRLIVRDLCGHTSTESIVVWLGTVFDNLNVRSPNNGDILGSTICVDGTAFDNFCFDQYEVEWQPNGGTFWNPVDSTMPVYTSTVINDPMATWDTVGGAIPDGNYSIRVRAVDDCGNMAEEARRITVDNTVPTTEITQPGPCEVIDGTIRIIGTAFDDNLSSWVVQYTGGDSSGWVTIASGAASVINDVLATWDTTNLRPCAYTIRLVATDQAVLNCNSALRHRSEYHVSVTVGEGLCGDCDGDGDVDLNDWREIETNFSGAQGP